MKTEFKAKFLQHVAKKRKEEGFTLIELLVVIIIIGILSAIALPSFLNQANKAKQSEAKQYLASINKGQQAYYVENSEFTAQITDLGLGIKTETENYTYEVVSADPSSSAQAYTSSTGGGLAGYAGLVFLIDAGDGAQTSQTILCEGAIGETAAPTVTATDCADTGGYTKAL
ncbi:type IV pilin-like G/H family protein [Dapis sp. BLCC M126]|uniref:type IV pilin-like G/H family protein n=1 Tax=Dapis sp. BLCC M126 TaxID=3400189 RepID=UPI003CF3F786